MKRKILFVLLSILAAMLLALILFMGTYVWHMYFQPIVAAPKAP